MLTSHLVAAGVALASLAPLRAEIKSFSHPERIRYDGQCLTVEGRDLFIYSGTFHYFRCPPPLWRERFQKIKDAGCNAVETYVPWNWHERRPPAALTDFSQVDLADLRAWLRMAHDEFGLYTIIRPGPYICAEWDGGGFPRWLFTKKPAGNPDRLWLRTNDPTFIAWSVHWLQAVCPVIAAEQVTRRPPGHGGVILFQIENEYDGYKEIALADRVPHLQALYRAARAGGIEVPIFSCWTTQCRDNPDPELSQVFDAVNSYPFDKIDQTAKQLTALALAQPDAPLMISELQGGWFGQIGGKLSEDQAGLSPAQFNADTLLAIQHGATLLNTYVLFGGTNFGDWAARHQTQSYDYNAPIREPGGVGEKYLSFAAIGGMLRRYGPELARARAIVCQAETGSPEVTVAARQARGGAIFLFFRNQSLLTPHRGTTLVWLPRGGQSSIAYDLGADGSMVLRLPPNETDPQKGEWFPQPASGPARPATVGAPVRLTSAERRPDPGASDWVPAPTGALLPALGVFDARTVVYQAELVLAPGQVPASAELTVASYKDDNAVIEVNGQILGTGKPSETLTGPWLRAGKNTVRILYDQAGEFNYERGIEEQEGLRSARLAVAGTGALLPLDWTLGRTLGGLAARWPALPAGRQPGWTALALDATSTLSRTGKAATLPPGSAEALATWYRVEFALPVAAPGSWIPWRARLDASGDGHVYLNGQDLGRYWEAGPQRDYFLPDCWLVPPGKRKNVLTFCLVPNRGGAVLRAVEIAPYAEQGEQR